MTSAFMTAAHDYAGRGIAVFPLRPREKTPSKDFRWRDEATTDAVQVSAWWARRPQANVAIATGAPAGFWVLDIDGADGAAALAALEAEHGALPATVEQSTGKGRHLCFAWDASAPEIRNSAGKIGPGVDVRGGGGYIVAPPSVHPSGRVYAWRDGHAPGQMDFARAPEWLTRLVTPRPVEAVPISDAKPRLKQEGRASPYGEAALTRACDDIGGARPGQQDLTLFWRSYSIGRLVSGGEIERGYAIEALRAAGARMIPAKRPWTVQEIADKVDRGLERGEGNPKAAPERRGPQAATPRAAAVAQVTPAELAAAAGDARGLWNEAGPADVGAVRTWLKLRRLTWDTPWARYALGQLRAHPSAPWNEQGERIPSLLIPMGVLAPDREPPDAVAVLPLFGGPAGRGADRPVHVIGDHAGKVAWLAPAGVPGSPDQIIVALDLMDAWALGEAAQDSEDPMGAAVALRVSAFCGGALGDRWGRVSMDAPKADPAHRPWACAGVSVAYLAVRHDLVTPEIRWRRRMGGTGRGRLEGGEAARFVGSLARQHWETPIEAGGPGAHAVRVLTPRAGRHGFHDHEAGGAVG